MAAGGEGYWHANYFHSNFWHVNYWAEAAPPAGPTTVGPTNRQVWLGAYRLLRLR